MKFKQTAFLKPCIESDTKLQKQAEIVLIYNFHYHYMKNK